MSTAALFIIAKWWKQPNVDQHFCCCCLVAKLCPTLLQPHGPQPGSSIHSISQTRVLEWVAIFFSSGSSRPGDQTCVSYIAGRFYTTCATFTQKCHSPVERNEVPAHTTTWMDLKNIKLCERSQKQKTTYCMIPCVQNVWKRQIYTDRNVRGCQELGVGRGNNCKWTQRLFLWQQKCCSAL